MIFTGTNGTAPYTFTYNINGGTSKTITSSGNSVTVYAPTDVTGTFTYNLVGITDATATHCYNPQSGSVQIVIDTLPVPVLLGPDLICADQTLDYETQSGNGIHDYAWTISNGSIEAGGTATDHTARVHWNNNTGPKSIYVNYTDGNGCQGATQVSVKSTSPTVPAFSSGPKVVCLNTEDAVYTVQGGFSDYAWEITGGVITGGGGSDDNTATVTWNAAGNQTISVNFNSGTCSAPAPTAYPVKVNPLPSASISANNLSVCQNDVAPVITFTGAEGQANYTFYYTKDGSASTIISSGNTAAITQPTNSPGTFVYVLDKVMDANGCEQPQPATVEVTVHTLPVATISKTPDVCIGSSSKPEITFTASNGTAPYKFTYKINGSVQPPAISTGGTYVFQVSTATAAIYEYELVSVEDVNGCTQMIADQNVTVTINPLPTATISGPDSVCAGSPANITLHGAGGTPEYTFIYKINGGADQTATTVSGNDAVINVNTATPGIYKYTLVSVQDASSSACQQLQTSSWTIVVSTPTVGGTVNGNKTICSGQTGSVTLSGETGKILRWESSTDGVSWNVINNTTHTLSYTALTVTTQYRAVIKSGFCGVEYSTAATITVNEANGGLMNVGNTHTNSKTVCAGTNLPVVVSGYTGTIQRWETSVDGGAHWIVQSEHDYFLNVLNIQQTTWYRVLTENLPCGPVYSEVAKVNVTPRPTGHIEGSTQICVGGSATITLQLTGAGTIQGTLSDGTPFSGVEGTPVYLTVSPGVPGTTYTISTLSDASCQAVAEKGDMDGVANIIVTAIPGPVVIKPEAATICKGGIVPLTSVLGQVENPEPISISKIVNMTIPNQDETTGVQSSIAVSGIPLGAIVDSVTAKFNVTHEMIDGVKINLGAPNGKVINIVNEVHGSNLTNTVIHSDATTHNIISSGSAPYTGIYSAYGEGTYSTQVGTSNTNTFTDLFGTITAPPNGNWTLFVYDVAPFATGTFDNWTLTIYYHVPVQSVKIIWSPVDGLYTDPSATIPYKSTDTLATVYAKPDTTITYTGTSANPASCTPPTQVTITMNPPPVVTINADYCAVSDKVQLTAHSEPPAETYTWSTGETSPTVDVDVAHVYVVSAKTSLGCVASAAMSVAQELVKNGDFEAPFDHNNPGFVTGYRWRASPNPPTPNSGSGGLRDERTYAVDTNAHIYHSLFYGYDHTSPVKHGKFMMINGATTEGVTIWQQTVNVLPNTNYYYSAWGTNLTAGNSARLQFSVNGVPMGTTAELSNIPSYEWRRFYYGSTNGWYSGSNTTAVIQIINLNPAAGGNDFGLDDISFATLAPFISKTGVPGSEVQELCKGDSIIPITYNIGTGGGGPEILNLPKGLHADFNGIVLAITGVPDTAGTFNFTVKTQGSCPDPVMASGTIKVNGQNLRLASAVNTDAQVICNSTGIAPIRYKINGQGSETSGAYAVGLPNGLSGSFNPGTKEFTITGAPDDTSGVFTYKVFVTGDYCHTDSIEGKITVNRQLITRIAGHNDQTLCINTPMESIQYEVAGTGTGAHVNGLPQGVSGTFNNGVFTISGQPETPGSFEYVITTDGTCSATALTGTIEVNSDASIELSSAPGTDAQEICFGAGITQIKYSTGGNVANVSFEDLPGNVSGTYNNGQVTLTGLPEAAGDYNYTITATGSCASADIKGDIIVNAPVEGGTLSLHYGSDCGGTGTIQLAGNSGDVKGWEKSEDGGNSWVFLSDTDDQLSFAVSKSTYYRAVIDGRSCSDENSNAVLVGLHNVWTGSQNTDWQNNQNWSDGMLPSFSSTCPNVVIPEVSTGKYPVLSTGTASVNNIVIEQHAMVTVNGGKLRIAGAITNDGVLDATHGTLEFNGSAAQTISGSMFKQKQVREVIVSNSAGLAVTNNGTDTLKISGILNFASSATKLNTGDNITLLSDINHTASLGVVRSSNIINGKFIVERYIHVGPGAHEKAWLLLAAPVTGQSIHDSWMEGGSTTVHGYGTQMTGVTGSSGFDLISPAPSIKYWSPQDNNWIGVLSAGAPVHNKEGYMVFVRGDRTAGYGDAANPTKLRAKGTVVTGKTILNVPQVADGFASLGNPYPSAIDLTKLTFSGTDPQPTVYVWNPNIGGDYGYGAYESYTKINGNFVTVPGGAVNNYIQSGQAFFVQTSNEPEVTITVNEDSKIALSNNTTYFRPMGRGGLEVPGTLMTNIFSGSKTSGTPADGTLQLFNNRYNNAIDLNDGRKLYNTGVSLAIDKEGNYLVVERRPELNRRDTIAFRTTGMTTSGGYTLQFNAIELNKPGLEAWLEDAFTGAKTPVNLDGLTNVEFSVTSDARSKAANRFRLVFENTKAPLPVTFISISAQQKDKVNIVNWKVAEQAGSEKYVIQKSTDGIHFNDLDSVRASGHNDAAYSWADQYPVNGFNYYRIKMVDHDNRATLSAVVRVTVSELRPTVTVIPNPIQGGVLNLWMKDMKPGRYQVRLLNSAGQILLNRMVTYTAGWQKEMISWDYKLPHGTYQLELTGEDGGKRVLTIMY